ncbi:MAG: phytanoyl-CoA dioxygenase family protein [Spirochaetaceae bacterium]|nr:phytanoyl-CoA dioxygenase family protein [Spirochaetaceae bacterium]
MAGAADHHVMDGSMGGAEMADRRVREFDERGYVVIRGLVSGAELEPMLVSYLAAARRERVIAGWNDHLQPGQIVQLGDPSAKLGWRAMPYFARIGALARTLGGDDMVLAYDQMIYKQPGQETEVLWHQDAGYDWPGSAGERGITCWLALVDVTRDQGTMTFLPGSHRHGIVPHHAAQDRNPIGGALEAEADTGAAEVVEYRATMFRELRLLDTYWALILVYPVYMTPLVAWIMVGFFREVPREMEEAALIDGCSQWGLFWRVVLPVAAPGFSTNKGILWGEMAAVGVTASIPVIAFALIVQKRLVRGLTLGAVQ